MSSPLATYSTFWTASPLVSTNCSLAFSSSWSVGTQDEVFAKGTFFAGAFSSTGATAFFFLVSFAASRSTFVVPLLSTATSLFSSYLTAFTASLLSTLGLALFKASLMAFNWSWVKFSGCAGSSTSTFWPSSSSVVASVKGAGADASCAISASLRLARASPLWSLISNSSFVKLTLPCAYLNSYLPAP